MLFVREGLASRNFTASHYLLKNNNASNNNAKTQRAQEISWLFLHKNKHHLRRCKSNSKVLNQPWVKNSLQEQANVLFLIFCSFNDPFLRISNPGWLSPSLKKRKKKKKLFRWGPVCRNSITCSVSHRMKYQSSECNYRILTCSVCRCGGYYAHDIYDLVEQSDLELHNISSVWPANVPRDFPRLSISVRYIWCLGHLFLTAELGGFLTSSRIRLPLAYPSEGAQPTGGRYESVTTRNKLCRGDVFFSVLIGEKFGTDKDRNVDLSTTYVERFRCLH